MDTKQANAVITRNYTAISRAVAQVIANHWKVAQSPEMRADTVAEVTQGAVVHLLSYSLPRFDASKATKSGDAAVDQFVKSAAANFARNWRKASANAPRDTVDTIGLRGDDDNAAPGRQPSALDPQAPAGSGASQAGSVVPEAFAGIARAQADSGLRAAIERLSENDRELCLGLMAGEEKQAIARRLGRSPAWVTIRCKALRAKLG